MYYRIPALELSLSVPLVLQAVFRRAGARGLIYDFLLLSCGIRLLMFQPCFDRILICQLFGPWYSTVITTSFCSVSVLCALVRPGPGDRNNVRNNKTDRGRAVENQQKRKAFRIISHILVSILVCYFPLVVTYFMCIADIVSTQFFLCEVVPPFLSITVITVFISPLFRMHSEGHLKHIMCFSKLKGYLPDTIFN